jgi:ribosomal protein L37E
MISTNGDARGYVMISTNGDAQPVAYGTSVSQHTSGYATIGLQRNGSTIRCRRCGTDNYITRDRCIKCGRRLHQMREEAVTCLCAS